jgi:ADP-ribosylglycohydrolase
VLGELGFENPTVRNKLLLLEDNAERIDQFRAAVSEAFPNWQDQVWDNAPAMLLNCEACLDETRLVSLDHDLNPQPGATGDPGCGRDTSKFLAGYLPFAPVIIHSTNADAAWSMHNDLRFARWRVTRVGPIGQDWIEKLWLPKASELLAGPVISRIRKLRAHTHRFEAALDSLEGLVVGEALGEMLGYNHAQAELTLERGLPPAPWLRTDDGEMALAIVETLKLYGYIHQDALSRRFAWRFELNPGRGYGQMTYSQLTDVLRGVDWRKAATAAFGGQGSMGNGGAMRVAPLGAYFFDNMERVVSEAARSATVTHAHPEGVAGAIAIAVAAAQAVRLRSADADNEAAQIFEAALNHTPQSKVREGILAARGLPPSQHIFKVALTVGNGSLVTAPDTVPYAIWCAAHNLRDFRRALMTTITGGGDCDTNAAIVGGIVGARVGREGIPPLWRTSKERLPF